MYLPMFVGVLCWSLLWYALLNVLSSFAIILTWKRELVAIHLLYFRFLVIVNVLCPFLTVPWVGVWHYLYLKCTVRIFSVSADKPLVKLCEDAYQRAHQKQNSNYLEVLRTLHSVHTLQSSAAFGQETLQNSCCSVELSEPEICQLLHFGIILHVMINENKCDQEIAQLSRNMRFPTMWYVRPAKPQISLRIRAV